MKLAVEDFLGKRTLIVGDVNSGKTTLSQAILDEFYRRGVGGNILILDLAPEIPVHLAASKGLRGVGGTLRPAQGERFRYLRPTLVPPRLMGTSHKEILEMAKANLLAIEEVMGQTWAEKETIFLNDVSMYLQAGSAQRLFSWLQAFHTVVANGYLGRSLGEGELSWRERSQMETLAALFDRVLRLG
ncbi:MAG: hypothetical protein WHX93_01940 [bacterium]